MRDRRDNRESAGKCRALPRSSTSGLEALSEALSGSFPFAGLKLKWDFLIEEPLDELSHRTSHHVASIGRFTVNIFIERTVAFLSIQSTSSFILSAWSHECLYCIS